MNQEELQRTRKESLDCLRDALSACGNPREWLLNNYMEQCRVLNVSIDEYFCDYTASGCGNDIEILCSLIEENIARIDSILKT